MILISHRGNIDGKKPERENSPEYILEAIEFGYHVEVDVWYKDNQLYLGHDGPQYETDVAFLKNEKLWCHCKNSEALAETMKVGKEMAIIGFWAQRIGSPRRVGGPRELRSEIAKGMCD